MNKKNSKTTEAGGVATMEPSTHENESAADVIDRINNEFPEGEESALNAPPLDDVPVLDSFRQQIVEFGPDYVWPLNFEEIVVDPVRNGREVEVKQTDKDVKELAESIKELGQQQPGWVTLESDNKLYLDFGNRRYAAIALINSTRHKQDHLPFKAFVRIATSTPIETRNAQLKRNFHENARRRELNVLDNVLVVTRFMEQGMNQKQVAAATGWSAASVNNYVKIGKFSDTVKGYIREDKLVARAAIELTALKDNDAIDKMAAELVAAAAEAGGTGKVSTSAAKKKKKGVATAATSQLTAKEFIEALDFIFSKENKKRLNKATEEILRIVADVIMGRTSQEKALEKLAAYQ